MKILYYLDYFPKLSESFILNEIYYLTQQGHEVAVFSLNEVEVDLSHEELDDIDVEIGYADGPSLSSLPNLLSRSIIDGSSYKTEFSKLRHRVGTRFLAKQCLDFVDSLDHGIDHVHSHFARWNKVAAAIVANEVEASSSLTTHAYDLYASPDEEALGVTCDAFDSVFTISEYNKRYIDVEIDPESHVEVVRMGIRTEKFTPTETPDEPRLITIGRFVEKKGIEYALHAVGNCVGDYPGLDYRIIGAGPRRDRYESIIEEREIEDNVTFLGSVSDEQLIDELDHAKAFLLPCVVAKDGDRDGIPVVLMEAMAMETPPITTCISGIPELVEHGENGFLCNERSMCEIESMIRSHLSREEVGSIISRRSRSTVQQSHEITAIGPNLESLFRNLKL